MNTLHLASNQSLKLTKNFASCQGILAYKKTRQFENNLATPAPDNLKAIAHKTLYLCTKFISLEFFRVNQLCNFLKWCSRKIYWSCLYCCENKKSKLVPQRKRFWNIKIFLFQIISRIPQKHFRFQHYGFTDTTRYQ